MNSLESTTPINNEKSVPRCPACGSTLERWSPGATLNRPPVCGGSFSKAAAWILRETADSLNRLQIPVATLQIGRDAVKLKAWFPDASKRCSGFTATWRQNSAANYANPLDAMRSLMLQTKGYDNVYQWLATGKIQSGEVLNIHSVHYYFDPVIKAPRFNDAAWNKAKAQFPGTNLESTDPVNLKKTLDHELAKKKRDLDTGNASADAMSVDLDEMKKARDVLLSRTQTPDDQNDGRRIRMCGSGVIGAFLIQGSEIWNPIG